MDDLRRRMVSINDDREWKWRIRTPRVGIAAVVESPKRDAVLLVSRIFPPRGIAFPGGFVELGESVEQTARREVMEETGLAVETVSLLNITSDPELDPRMHICVAAGVFRLVDGSSERPSPRAGDDAGDAFWLHLHRFRRGDIQGLTPRTRIIAADYLRWCDIGRPILPLS